MKIKIFNRSVDMADFLAHKIQNLLNSNSEQCFCFPSGETPRDLFKSLSILGKTELAKMKLIALDEWVGVDRLNTGSCYSMFSRDLLKPLGINDEKMFFLNGMASDLNFECKRIDSFLANNKINVAVVGVGLNGHIGLNEPNCEFSGGAKVIDLDEITRSVAPAKYFSGEINLTQGITLSLEQLSKAEETIIMVIGSKKAQIVKDFIENPSKNLPASYLAGQPNSVIYLDKESSSLLQLDKLDVEYIS